MPSIPEELTINYSEGGVDVVKELDKEVLSKGAWTTILFRYQDWDPRKEVYSKDKYSIRRYQKRNGEYQQKSKFNISSKDQAKAIIEALTAKMRRNLPKDIRVATAWFKPKYNLTDIIPDYYIHKTDQWLVFPHELEGLTREEIFKNKSGMKKLFEDAGLV